MQELRQLYDEQANPKPGQGATKDKIFKDGLLHGAAHVWVWRKTSHGLEVLLQLRAASKRTWPNFYDISAAGHIDLGEEPITAAIRETKEEIGLAVSEPDLKFVGRHRWNGVIAENGDIENEFRWIYLYELPDKTDFKLRPAEVASLQWKSLKDFEAECLQPDSKYVPQGQDYFDNVIAALKKC